MLLAILTAAATCFDPASYGAVPDDDRPDTAALQQAIDAAAAAGGRVCLGAGVFRVERVDHGKRAFGSLVIRRGPLEMSGAGPATVIRMTGPGRRDDWRAIEIQGARDVHLHDFAIDGLDAYDTEEQTHLIEVGPASTQVTINRMTLGPMRRADQRIGQGVGGDCIRLLGKIGAEVTDVAITHTTFTACDRSGISLQRSLRRILIAHDTIRDTGDQAVDFEPTGRGSIEDVAMVHLVIEHHPDAQGANAIAIGGHGRYPARRITLADSRITGGGVRVLDAIDVQLLRNTVDFGARQKGPVIAIVRRVAGVRLVRNTIVRPATAGAGPILLATHLHGHAPRQISLDGNVLRQHTAAAIANLTSVGGVAVRRNKLEYHGDPKLAVVNVVAVLGDLDDVTVADNELTGEAAAVLAVKTGVHRIRAVEVRGNVAPRAASVACKGDASAFEGIRADTAGIACGVAQPLRPRGRR